MFVAVVGKGGVGKTTVSALLVRRFLDARQTPVLAVDADPSNCFGPALGLSVEKTLAHLRNSMRDNPDRPPSVAQADWLARQAEDAIIEGTGLDLVTMGHSEGPGCYCFVNNLIRGYLERLTRTYRHVVVDCEAGLEHLSRRTAGKPDRLVCVVSRARMSAQTVRSALGIYRDLHGELPGQVDLVLNGLDRDEALAADLRAAASGGDMPFTREFCVPWDPAVSALDGAGRSLLELPPEAPALAALEGW